LFFIGDYCGNARVGGSAMGLIAPGADRIAEQRRGGDQVGIDFE
jgi:hypothetical protein